MQTHGRDLRFLALFALFMSIYYVLTTTVWVKDTFFPNYLEATASVSTAVLNTFGYDDVERDGKTLKAPSGAGSVTVERGCDAVAPTALFVSAMLASPAPMALRVGPVFLGIFILMVVNVVRIVTLFLTRIHWQKMFDVMHLDIWQALFIILAILLWAYWASWASKVQRRKAKAAEAAGDQPKQANA